MQMPDGTMRAMTDEEQATAEKMRAMHGRIQKGGVFVGQPVEINGAHFVVRKITKKDVILRGVPGK
jgi:hypothetical protein